MSGTIPLPIALGLGLAMVIGFLIGCYLGHRMGVDDGFRGFCEVMVEIDPDKKLLKKFWDVAEKKGLVRRKL